RVMGQYLAFDAVFKWRDDRSAIGIILRVGGKYKLDVERQPQPEPANLDIFLLQHIEKGNLDTGLEVGELVNHENTAVCPWDQSEVDDPFVVVGQFKRSRFNWVDIPYEVRHGHVWSSQFFCIPLRAVQPCNRRVVALCLDFVACIPRDGVKGVVKQFTARHVWHILVEEGYH